jgi:hypothetical protein
MAFCCIWPLGYAACAASWRTCSWAEDSCLIVLNQSCCGSTSSSLHSIALRFILRSLAVVADSGWRELMDASGWDTVGVGSRAGEATWTRFLEDEVVPGFMTTFLAGECS